MPLVVMPIIIVYLSYPNNNKFFFYIQKLTALCVSALSVLPQVGLKQKRKK